MSKTNYTTSDLTALFSIGEHGKATVIDTLPGVDMEVGKVYANLNVGLHWAMVKAGIREHTPRGQDTGVRKGANKTVATRYFEKTGRKIEDEMEFEKGMIELMYDAAAEIEDPMDRFQALKEAQKAQNKFNSTWLPYSEQKLGVLQSTTTVEDKITVDDILMKTVGEDE